MPDFKIITSCSTVEFPVLSYNNPQLVDNQGIMINFANYCPDGQQRSYCAYPSTPHWRSLCGDKALYINHVPRSGSNYRASTGGRFGTAPRYGMEGGIRTPQRHFAPGASLPCAPCHCGAGGIRNRSAVLLYFLVGATVRPHPPPKKSAKSA